MGEFSFKGVNKYAELRRIYGKVLEFEKLYREKGEKRADELDAMEVLVK